MARISNSKTSFSKTDFRYWEQRVFFPTKNFRGDIHESKIYSIRIQVNGHRETFSTGESSKRAAGKKSVEIYHCIKGAGWAEARKRFKGQMEVLTDLSVGEFIEEVSKVTSLKARTFKTYVYKFRRIVSEVANIKDADGTNRRDYVNGGAKAWRDRVNAVKLRRITPEKVNRWKLEYLKKAKPDPRDQQAKRRTVNSNIRNAKSLFSRKHLNFLKHIELPDPLPFDGVIYESEGSYRYRSQCEPHELLQAATEELYAAIPKNEVALYKGIPMHPLLPRAREIAQIQANSKREAFKILLLALTVGLRRNEIDKLQWSQFIWNKGILRIEPTDCFEPKADSCGDMPVDFEVLQFFREQWEKSQGKFVIDGGEAKPQVTYRHYRAHRHFDTLITWLKSQGISSRNPIHALRKEYGTLICAQAGIHAASSLLRHSDIRITSKHYVDNKQQVVSGLGPVLTMATSAPDFEDEALQATG
ncbi:MAG: hypothetical protein CMO55_23370 [Verrucomicrobiales bacterium]|nr:hypothetical protein [Verrucomicrobiales bacterium]